MNLEKDLENGYYQEKEELDVPAKMLLRKVKVGTGKYFGSDEERHEYVRKAVSLFARFHQGSLLLTISPDNTSSIFSSLYSNSVKSKDIKDFNVENGPLLLQRIQIPSKNCLAWSYCFSKIIELVIEDIVGWNVAKSRPYRNGEVFEVVRAFIGGVEAQKKTTLHLHLVAFLSGLPRTIGEFENICKEKSQGETSILRGFNNKNKLNNDRKNIYCITCMEDRVF